MFSRTLERVGLQAVTLTSIYATIDNKSFLCYNTSLGEYY